MLSLSKKIATIALFSFVAYKAIGYYIIHTLPQSIAPQCTSAEEMASLKERKASGPEVEKFMHTVFTCVKAKQSFLQAHYFPVPENWLNPPPGSVTYNDIPEF